MTQKNIAAPTDCSSFTELLRWRAHRDANRTVYTFLEDGDGEAKSITYREFDRLARAIGAWLQSFDAAGERALLLYQPSLDYIAAFFGCLYAGVIAVPAYPPRPNRPMPRIQAIIEDAQAKFLLTTSPIMADIQQRFPQYPQLADLQFLSTDQLPVGLEDRWQDPGVNGETLAFLQYTSGSTATPKGVMVSHGNLLYNELMLEHAFEHTQESTYVTWLPLYHDMGLIGNVLQGLYIGTHAVIMSPMAFLQRPYRWLQAITRYRAHTSGAPNFAYELCVNKITPEQRETLDLSSWRLAFNGAEPVRASTIERFTAAFAPHGFRPEAMYPCYGLAEATLFVTGGKKAAVPILQPFQAAALEKKQVRPASAADDQARTLVGCGHTWLEQQVVIVDPETCTRSPADQIGEIWISGLNVAQGYWNRAAETERTFRAHLADTGEGPFLRTGDLGFMRDGELFVTGRLKDLIIIEGRNHYPQDIELTAEQSHPALRAGCSAAFSVDIDGREQLVIVAEVERQYRPQLSGATGASGNDATEVIKAIRQAVTRNHELQTHSVLLLKTGTIPKTSSGKIQRHACRIGFLEGKLEVWGT
jgi:acyl-CoA synthetase (AMP-forming)/AMP-acid ligase II